MLSVAAGTGVSRHGGEAAAWQLLQTRGIMNGMRSGVAAQGRCAGACSNAAQPSMMPASLRSNASRSRARELLSRHWHQHKLVQVSQDSILDVYDQSQKPRSSVCGFNTFTASVAIRSERMRTSGMMNGVC